MRAGCGIQDAEFGASAAGLDLRAARHGDVVLIAGKGHETYQVIKGVRHPFSDLAVARAALKGTAA